MKSLLPFAIFSILALPAHADPCQDFLLAANAYASVTERYGNDHELEKVARNKVNEARADAAAHVTDSLNSEAIEALFGSMVMAGFAYDLAAATWNDQNLLDKIWDGFVRAALALDVAILHECSVADK
ncbi:MAG: hypothetical protein OXH76_01270 [Boseongicola sp.]|nr:hypothetical protein [Boseongicola sp.]